MEAEDNQEDAEEIKRLENNISQQYNKGEKRDRTQDTKPPTPKHQRTSQQEESSSDENSGTDSGTNSDSESDTSRKTEKSGRKYLNSTTKSTKSPTDKVTRMNYIQEIPTIVKPITRYHSNPETPAEWKKLPEIPEQKIWALETPDRRSTDEGRHYE